MYLLSGQLGCVGRPVFCVVLTNLFLNNFVGHFKNHVA